MIYFLRLENGLIKIGHTMDLRLRFNQHMTNRKQDFEFLGYMEGDHVEERRMHTQFEAYRAGPEEWFKENPELMSLIEQRAIKAKRSELPKRADDAESTSYSGSLEKSVSISVALPASHRAMLDDIRRQDAASLGCDGLAGTSKTIRLLISREWHRRKAIESNCVTEQA